MANYTRDADAISRLSREQFRVTQQGATERPFENAYWDHDAPGLYVDIVSGEPLFLPSTNLTANVAGRVSPNPLTLKTSRSGLTTLSE